MGKNIIQQARGKGSPTYRAPSFRYKAKVAYPKHSSAGEVLDLIKCQGHSSPLAQIKYKSGEITFTIAAEGIRKGDKVQIGVNADINTGNGMLRMHLNMLTSSHLRQVL